MEINNVVCSSICKRSQVVRLIALFSLLFASFPVFCAQALHKESYKIGKFTASIGSSQKQNFRFNRKQKSLLEDRMAFGYTAQAQELIVGIFDGHAGDELADFLAKKFYETYGLIERENHNRQNPALSTSLKIEAALYSVETWFKNNYKEKNNTIPLCGSTASIVHINDKKITLGWVGDSTAVVYHKPHQDIQGNFAIVFDATHDHHVSSAQELRRIINLYGGETSFRKILTTLYNDPANHDFDLFYSASRLSSWEKALKSLAQKGSKKAPSKNLRLGGLNLARDLGSFDLKKMGPTINGAVKPALSNQPDFLEIPTEHEMLIVVASDGLWDYFKKDNYSQGITPAELYEVIQDLQRQGFSPQKIADYLASQSGRTFQLAGTRKNITEYDDDVSVVIIALNAKKN